MASESLTLAQHGFKSAAKWPKMASRGFQNSIDLEENIVIESELKNLYNPKKIIVEKYNDEISNYKEMFREYPMFYKINSVVNLALDSDNYDLMFLVRLDVVYEKKFDFLSIKKDIFYYGQGVFDPLINKVRKY